MQRWLGLGAMVGGVLYAVAGAVWSATNLRWFGWTPQAHPFGDPSVWLGIGLSLVVAGFAVQHGADIRSRGALGRWIARTSLVAPLFLLLSPVIQFAIFGTLLTFVALLLFTLLVHQNHLLPRGDVGLLGVATVASITWNTETPSAALLVLVGLVAAWVSYRALLAGHGRTSKERIPLG